MQDPTDENRDNSLLYRWVLHIHQLAWINQNYKDKGR